jgi:hypothetical protein
VARFERLERAKDDLRDDQVGVLLVIGGNDIPRRLVGARCTKAILIRLNVLLPGLPFLDVGLAAVPILLGFVDTLDETLALPRF